MKCRHCDRPIALRAGQWIDPYATGDDSLWRETCDSNDTFPADHEPRQDLWDIDNGCIHDWQYINNDQTTMKCQHCGHYQN